ncbi:MAG: nucleotide exchange factor GrpE [Candidatus Micrarchaeota archaeon]|nr:nucleotide exchange factor GrpE [Candidatus Micrarchaeota archaeon]
MAQEEENKNKPQQNGKKETKQQDSEQKQQTDELAETKDRLLRLAAEFDNYKKKAAKDVDMSKNAGKAELIRSLLPAIDEFELALAAFGNSDHDREHIKGIELVFSNVLGTLKSAGLKEIDSKGTYDPYKHEIILTRESKEPEGTIIEIVRKGYAFNEMLLRPSAVIVSKGNASKEETKGE